MGFRLKTSEETKDIFGQLSASTNLKPFALAKIAIAFSLNSEESIDGFPMGDMNGLELQLATITGEDDLAYRLLLENNVKRSLSDDEYCPHYLKKHIDRGARLFMNRYRYSGASLEKFLTTVIDNKGGL